MMWVIFTFLVIAGVIIFPFFIKELATNNILFTTVEEGRAKAIVSAGGGFHKILMHYKGYECIKEKEWTIAAIDSRSLPETLRDKLGLGAIYWIGFPFFHRVYWYNFRWNSLRQTDQEDGVVNAGGIFFKPHDERLDYILVQTDVYYARIENAEDRDMVPLNIDMALSITIVNPYKALFRTQDWLEMVWGLILPAIRRYVGDEKWKDLTHKVAEHEEAFKEQVLNKDAKNIENDFGVRIDSFRILRVSPGGTRATMYEEAATKAFEAEAKAKEIRIKAQAERDRIEMVYGKIREYGELGQLLQRLEALEKAAQGSGNFVISAPELAGIGKAVENIAKSRP